MKKISTIIISSGLLLLAAAAGIFYYQNLRGIGPAINKPPEDITKNENTTGLPLKLPEGFSISTYAKGLSGPRVMTHEPSGNIMVSETSAGRVSVVIDKNGDGRAEDRISVIEGLNNPHGIAFRCSGEPINPPKCKIYIAETDKVVEYDYDGVKLKAGNGKRIIDLPGAGGHYTRTLLFMPYPDEDNLLISVGSSCNVCTESDDRRASILKYNVRTGQLTKFADGLRNTVFMGIHPVTGEIWGTDMGRDLIGDDVPPEEINIIKEGKNYGWPICYGENTVDISISSNKVSCAGKQPSHIGMQAHSAPLGLAFIPEEGWPEEYWHNLLVAFHGSWNRTEPTGYKIVRIKLDAEGKVLSGPEDFITGWLTKEGALGRPVDIMIQPGGTIYISDDKAGVIYRVSRN